jgi:hypothetical protein
VRSVDAEQLALSGHAAATASTDRLPDPVA